MIDIASMCNLQTFRLVNLVKILLKLLPSGLLKLVFKLFSNQGIFGTKTMVIFSIDSMDEPLVNARNVK